MAGIFKKKGKSAWYACWKTGGKTIQRTTGVLIKQPGLSEKKTKQMAATVAEAMERAAKGDVPVMKALDAVRNAACLSGSGMKIPSVRDYLENFNFTGAEKHRLEQKRVFKLFLDSLGGDADKRLDQITTAHCKNFVHRILERLSITTAKVNRNIVSFAFNCAIRDDLIVKNPFFGVTVSKEAQAVCPEKLKQKRKLDAFSAEEVSFMIRNFPAPWNDMVLVCVGSGGQRIGDICCLKWESVDFEAGLLKLDTQKTGHVINNPIAPVLVERFKELYEQRDVKSPYVFPYMARLYQQGGGRVSTDFTNLLKLHHLAEDRVPSARSGAERRVSSKSFHSLRRFAVSWMRENGVSADLCRDIVGHDSEEVERVYMRASRSKKADALNAMIDAVTTDATPIPTMPDLPKYKKEA